MHLSPHHAAARLAAAIVPAQQASLALLNAAPGPGVVLFHGGTPPTPGEAAPAAALATVPLNRPAGSVHPDTGTITLLPAEAMITGADPDHGTVATWARILDGGGTWWGDASVSGAEGDGDIKLASTTLLNGAYVRIESATLAAAV